jgi:hypothetical protein
MPFRISERDLDLLQLEELHADTGYADWFAARIGLGGYRFVSAEHSVSASANGQSGETDVLAFFESGPSHIAVMIEDKVAANFTTRQAHRYHERGEKLRVLGKCTGYQTVLVAPESYLAGVPSNDPWQHRVSVEVLAQWFAAQSDFRAKWRHTILTKIVSRAAGVLRPNQEHLHRFYEAFDHYLKQGSEGILWCDTRTSSVGPTFQFRGKGKGFTLWWKFSTDQVILQLDNSQISFPDSIALPQQVSVERGGDHARKTDYFSVKVTPIDLSLGIDDQLNAIDDAISAATLLSQFALRLQGNDPSV